MQRFKTNLYYFGLWAILSLFSYGGLGGCGGSGSTSSSSSEGGAGAIGGSGSALTVTEKVSVVDAQSSAEPALIKALSSIKSLVSDLPDDSDYNTDETFVFVQERSTEIFNTVNEILCMIDQTSYNDMINLGDYLAYIDTNQCEKNSDEVEGVSQTSQDQSSSTTAPNYEEWTVNSYRADNNSPHIVATWIHMSGDEFDPAMLIKTRMEITESKSISNPYGIFKMDFQAFMEDDNGNVGTDAVMRGYLLTERVDGVILLKFFNTSDFENGGFNEKVTLNREGSNIRGHLQSSENFDSASHDKEFIIAADDNYFYRSDGENNVCLNRSDFDETVHRYNLYYTEDNANPGALVTRNSGFPITFTNDDNKKFHGWIGYWGVWMPEEAGIENGDTVNKETFGGPGSENSGTPYRLFIAPGKLKKHTRQTVSMADISGVPLSWGQCSFEGGCTNYQVEWNKNTQKLMKTHQVNEENWVPEAITPEEVEFSDSDYDFYFWSQSLGGAGQVMLRDPSTGELSTLTNDSSVVFYRENVVYPGDDDMPTSLACFDRCPDPSDPSSYLDASSWEAGEDSYQSLAQSVPPGSLVAGTHYASYTFDADNMVLKNGSSPIVTEDEGEFGSGIWTGTLIPVSELPNLACDWDEDTTCAWKSRNIDTFYTWETGPNDWNQLSLLQDPSNDEFLTFDPPLFVEYTDEEEIKYFLDFSGPGQLHGIPGKCVSMDTGEDIDCGEWNEDSPIRWVPAFNISDGATVIDVATDENYYVKAIDKEQRMKAVAESNCTNAGLELPDFTLPDESLWEEPIIGDEPDITGAPAVIGGVIQ